MYYVEFLDGTTILISDCSFLEEEPKYCIEITDYNPHFMYQFDGEQLISIEKPNYAVSKQDYSSKSIFSNVINSI